MVWYNELPGDKGACYFKMLRPLETVEINKNRVFGIGHPKEFPNQKKESLLHRFWERPDKNIDCCELVFMLLHVLWTDLNKRAQRCNSKVHLAGIH